MARRVATPDDRNLLRGRLWAQHKGDCLSVAHHPYRNVLCTFSEDGEIKIWALLGTAGRGLPF